jgi:hypothetical protein
MILTLLAQAVVASGAEQPHLAASEDGSFYATFIRGGNIGFAASADGKTWSEPAVAIDARGRAKGGMQRGPRIAVDAKMTIYVTAPLCFDEAEFTKKYPTSDLYLAVSTDGGKTFTKPAQLNDVPKKAAEALHWLAVADDGTAHVAWLDHREEDVNCLWYTRVKGDKPEKNRRLTGPVCECCAPGLTLDGKGNPVLVVREGGKGDRGVLLLRSRNGGASFDKALPVHDAETNVDT